MKSIQYILFHPENVLASKGYFYVVVIDNSKTACLFFFFKQLLNDILKNVF